MRLAGEVEGEGARKAAEAALASVRLDPIIASTVKSLEKPP